MKRNYLKTLLIVIGIGLIVSTYFYVSYPTAYQVKNHHYNENIYDALEGDEYWKLSLAITVGVALIVVALGLKKEQSHTKNEEVKKTIEESKSTFRNRDSMEKLCKDLGISFSKNTQQSGTASIHFRNKPKGKEDK